ncbi:MAG: DUF5995 family protein [Chitinophagaceae bacterium]
MTTIQEVLDRLDAIVLRCENAPSRLGYFAALYRSMTLAVQQGIAQKTFGSAERMERLDVIFAKRYIDAFDAWEKNQPVSKGWQAAFTASADRLTVIQHLILGVNTHINLDLAIAAAETCPDGDILVMQADFDLINDTISSLVGEVQDKLTKVWWPLRFIRDITNKKEDAVINFSIVSARKASWANAVALSAIQGSARTNYINGIDNTVTSLASGIIKPGFMVNLALKFVRMFEYKDVKRVIQLIK